MTPAAEEDVTAGADHGAPDGVTRESDSGSSLERLFAPWPAVVVAEARLPAAPPAMFPEEAAQVARAVVRRQVEFATVRGCARGAAARLGVVPFALTNGPDRAPIWPVELVGALTHTGAAPGGYCAAAVARRAQIAAVGLDAEKAEPLPLRLWSFVLTTSEQLRLTGDDPGRQGLLAKIIFSAKECFYKAQFPLTRRFLGFHDVEIALDVGGQTFEACLVGGAARVAPPGFPGGRWAGRFAVEDALVTTAIAVLR